MSLADHTLALDRLRAILASQDTDAELADILKQRVPVLARYQGVFKTGEIQQLTEEQFKSFLQFENNRHWTGLNRNSQLVCADMPALREALTLLLDENQPLVERLNEVADESSAWARR